MGRRLLAGVASAALAIAAGTVLGSGGLASASSGSAGNEVARASASKSIRFEQHDLYIEFNATAGDAGLQLVPTRRAGGNSLSTTRRGRC